MFKFLSVLKKWSDWVLNVDGISDAIFLQDSVDEVPELAYE
jgi:hypothetical protein